MVDVLILRSVRAIDPPHLDEEEIDLVIERGRILSMGYSAAGSWKASDRVRILNGKGWWVLPGLTDLHVHLREPGHEYKEDLQSGLKAAAAGGFVNVCAMPNTSPINDTRAVTEMLIAKANLIGGVRVHPIAAITIGQKGEKLTEMVALKAGGAVAFSDDGRCVTSAKVMKQAFEYASTLDLPLIQHAEDHSLTQDAQMHEGAISTQLGLKGWPRIAEDLIVARDVLLAEYTKARYHVAHLSTQGAVRIVREAKSRGLSVTAEVTPHHLLLIDQDVIGYRTACKVNPPLREEEDRVALLEALADGTIDCIATDHAPHSPLEKECEFSRALPGMIGLELCLPLLLPLVHRGLFPLARFIDALVSKPTRIVGLIPPTLREGAPADLTVIDPHAQWTIDADQLLSKSKNTPFHGYQAQGRIMMTLIGGQIAFESSP
ncbi:dihydroorotase [Pajaroellobacter abortibovis]|uniref:Dihydroorotase n=2 Tax=Pajaroellobacter abortibovis TaxID=1882918 RepID=A0A1L6MZT6_9BACT|nr:dihydroorotase [Pajaroellobacter abortibovis]